MKKSGLEAIKDRLNEPQNDRTKTSIYVSKRLWRAFKKACEPHSTSVVLEELLKSHVGDQSLKGR